MARAMTDQGAEVIGTVASPSCRLCGREGVKLYQGLKDELFGAPGSWQIKRCPDPSCGLLWLDPAPLSTELHKAYRSYYTHLAPLSPQAEDDNWLRRRVKGLYGHLVHYCGLLRARRILLLQHLGQEPGRLLEIGCGDGGFLAQARSAGWQVTGVDSDPLAARAALEKYAIAVQVGLFEECFFPQEEFDLIVMNHVIEHVQDPVSFLAGCCKVLKAGGRLLMVTPNSAALSHSIFRSRWRGLEPPRHLNVFSPKALAAAACRAGFEVKQLGTTSVNAEAFFQGSTRGRATGADGRPGMRLTLLSWLYQYCALAYQFCRPQRGEEIVAVCLKSPTAKAKEPRS